MTDVNRGDLTPISHVEDAIPFYRGNGQAEDRQRMGMEAEMFVYRRGADGKPAAATAQECAALLDTLKDRGQQPQLEMTSAVEYASPAFRVTETAALTREVKESLQAYDAAIADQGLLRADSALMPFATLDSARDNLVDRDRARGLVKGMGLFKAPEFLKVTLLCTSTQVSLSYKDPEDLYASLSIGYAMGPAIFGLFENHPPYIEGKQEAVDFNPRPAFYEAFGRDGGIAQSFLQAKDGDDFIRKHVEQVFDTEMLYYYDQKQEIVWPEKPVRFSDLEALGLNNRSNYDLAESFVYTDIKIANIRDEHGTPVAKRMEIRGIDAGFMGAEAAVPFVHAILRDPGTRDEVQGLLHDYGLATDQPGWQDRLERGRHAAAFHGGKYLDVPYGLRPDGSQGSLRDFTRDLGRILARYAARNPGVAEALKPLIEIAETGVPLAQQKARVTRGYDQALGLPFPAAVNDDSSVRKAVAKAFG